jgi:hypothetical protein
MKDLEGSAYTAIAASPAESIPMLAAVDRYAEWYPDVIRRAEVLERDGDGTPTRASTTVRLSLGPVGNEFQLEIAVAVVPAREVKLTRIPHDGKDEERLELRWLTRPGRLGVEVSARLEVPRFLPIGGAGDSVAQGFVEAAKRVLDASTPNASASSS